MSGGPAPYSANAMRVPSLLVQKRMDCLGERMVVGECEWTIDWAARFTAQPDPWKFIAYRSLPLANFLMGRYDLAAEVARRAVQFNPDPGVRTCC